MVTTDFKTYGSILGALSIAALECDPVALVLKTLGSDQTLNLWCLGVWLLALTLWLNLTTDDEFTDLTKTYQHFCFGFTSHTLSLKHQHECG
jgi:hypothetical protein